MNYCERCRVVENPTTSVEILKILGKGKYRDDFRVGDLL